MKFILLFIFFATNLLIFCVADPESTMLAESNQAATDFNEYCPFDSTDGKRWQSNMHSASLYKGMDAALESDWSSYQWINGKDKVKGIECQKLFISHKQFMDESDYTQNCAKKIGSEFRVYRLVSFYSSNGVNVTTNFNPYLITNYCGSKMGEARTFNYETITENSRQKTNTTTVNTPLGFEDVKTRFGNYRQCLKYQEVKTDNIVLPDGSKTKLIYTTTFWNAKGIGTVKMKMSGAQGTTVTEIQEVVGE